jgi:hypothetical protein
LRRSACWAERIAASNRSARHGGELKPSWYVLATKDRTVHPELQRFVAKRMGGTTIQVASSHVAMLSNASLVLDVIRSAVGAVQKAGPGR